MNLGQANVNMSSKIFISLKKGGREEGGGGGGRGRGGRWRGNRRGGG